MSTLRRIADRMRSIDEARGESHKRKGYYTDRARPIAEARDKFEKYTEFKQNNATRKNVPFKLNTKEERELAKREKDFRYMELTKKREENARKNKELGVAKKAERAAKKRQSAEDDDFTSMFGKMGFGGTRRRRRHHRRTRRSTRA
jgi:hypothetical protein